MFVKTGEKVKRILMSIAVIIAFSLLTTQDSAGSQCGESSQPGDVQTCYDDLGYDKLAEGLARSIHALGKNRSPVFQLCGQSVNTSRLRPHYSRLLEYLEHGHSSEEISTYINNNFRFCRPNPVLITGYYEPIVKASLLQTREFPVPLYSVPLDMLADIPPKFKASRADIENSDLLQGYEVAYVSTLFTAFTIHVQGSGLLTFNDGTLRQIHYQTNNGREYSSVGRVLIDQNKIKRQDMSMQAIKAYTLAHPDQTRSLLQNNERFIYFTLGKPVTSPESPSGSLGVPLTPQRSVALDPQLYPPGILLYIQGTLPVPISARNTKQVRFHRREFSRFTVNQDSGGAIKGYQRVDLFMGRGDMAETLAGEMQERGCLQILLPK
jgi:membrane-bound lytic murein transglycosylase A